MTIAQRTGLLDRQTLYVRSQIGQLPSDFVLTQDYNVAPTMFPLHFGNVRANARI